MNMPPPWKMMNGLARFVLLVVWNEKCLNSKVMYGVTLFTNSVG